MPSDFTLQITFKNRHLLNFVIVSKKNILNYLKVYSNIQSLFKYLPLSNCVGPECLHIFSSKRCISTHWMQKEETPAVCF